MVNSKLISPCIKLCTGPANESTFGSYWMTRNARPKSRCLGLTYAHPSVQGYALVLVDTVATDSMGKSPRTSGGSSYSFMHIQHTFQLLVWPCHGASSSGCFPPANCAPVHVTLEKKTTQIDEMPAIYRVRSSSDPESGFPGTMGVGQSGFLLLPSL
jgi:hypothetical protein